MKLVAGSGGKGACSFHSEPRKEWGGPDGGNGGDGGSIIIKGKLKVSCQHSLGQSSILCVMPNGFDTLYFCVLSADRVVKSLAQITPVYKGEDGQSGGSKNCYGRNGSPKYISVSPCISS